MNSLLLRFKFPALSRTARKNSLLSGAGKLNKSGSDFSQLAGPTHNKTGEIGKNSLQFSLPAGNILPRPVRSGLCHQPVIKYLILHELLSAPEAWFASRFAFGSAVAMTAPHLCLAGRPEARVCPALRSSSAICASNPARSSFH
jgi:hypothetical protein